MVKMFAQGRGRWAVSQKRIMVEQFTLQTSDLP